MSVLVMFYELTKGRLAALEASFVQARLVQDQRQCLMSVVLVAQGEGGLTEAERAEYVVGHQDVVFRARIRADLALDVLAQ